MPVEFIIYPGSNDMKHSRAILVLILLSTFLLASASTAFAAPLSQSSNGKQIVFLMGDEKQKFTSVSITGTNQNSQSVTWNRAEANGFSIAYTKDWWWVGDFTKIDFTVRDSQGNESEQVCTFDSLEQPADSPRVEIVYYPGQGCVGGEAGSAVDPLGQSLKPIRDAFDTINQYLPEDKFNLFMTVVNNELNASGCVLGVAAIIKTGGMAAMDSTVRAYVMKTCQSTGNMIYDIFKDQ
jgi:hypothetical protein